MFFLVFRCACVLLALIGSLILGLGAVLRKHKPVLHQIFAFMAFLLAAYEISIFQTLTAPSEAQAWFWIQASYLGIYLFSCALLFLSYTFLHNGVLSQWLWKYVLITFITATTVALLLPDQIVGIDMSGVAPKVEYSGNWSLSALLVTLNALLSVSNFYRAWRRDKGLRHAQAPYLVGGVFGFWAVGTAVGFLFPLVGHTEVQGLGAAASILMLLPIGYAIMRYRLFDISALARRLIAFFINSLFLVSVYLLVFFAFGYSFSFQKEAAFENAVFCLIVASLVSASLLLKVRSGVQQTLLKYVLPEAYDLGALAQNFSGTLRKVADLDKLVVEILRGLCREMGISDARIFLRVKGTREFVQVAQEGTLGENLPRECSADDAFVQRLHPGEDVLIREELERFNFGLASRSVQRELGQLEAEVVIPLGISKELTGFVILGRKYSGHIYTREDIEFFLLLSNQLAISIENSVLYSELTNDKLYQEAILNNLSSGVITVDFSKRVTSVNRPAEEILGVSAQQVLGRPVAEIAGTFDLMLIKSLNQKTRVFQEEIYIELRSGRRLPLRLNLSPLRNAEDEVIGGLVVFTDLSEVKQLQMEVRRTEQLASLGTLAAGVAHEIKNPLVSIKTFAQLFPERYQDEEFRTSFYRLASKEIDRINTLVEHLLNLAKPANIVYESICLTDVLDEAISLLDVELKQRRIRIKTDYACDGALVPADHRQMKQVFLNFLLNAKDSIGTDGAIRVRTRRAPSPVSGTKTAPVFAGEQLLVEIEDSGIGISEETLPRIFDPFFTTKGEGTGLGLSISHKIITDHGGTISVASHPGKTVFSIYFPIVFQEALARS